MQRSIHASLGGFRRGLGEPLESGQPPSPSSGPVQFRFTLVPAVSAVNGSQNHLPAYFTDNRTSQKQLGESATYTLSAGQSVDIHFLYPQAGPDTLSYGSLVVQYSSFDPGTLRRQANPQLAFLARPSGEAYSSQITERAAVAANTWTAPVAMSADPNATPQAYRQASAAINNPGSTPVAVRGTLRDKNGNIVTYNDFQIPAFGATGIVFSWDPGQPFGGFGNAAFPQGHGLQRLGDLRCHLARQQRSQCAGPAVCGQYDFRCQRPIVAMTASAASEKVIAA